MSKFTLELLEPMQDSLKSTLTTGEGWVTRINMFRAMTASNLTAIGAPGPRCLTSPGTSHGITGGKPEAA